MPDERAGDTEWQVRPTVLDVLDNFFEAMPTESAIRSLTVSRMDELGELLLESALAECEDPAPADCYYLGGSVGGMWHQEQQSSALHLALLYYPRLLVHNPLADYFFPDLDDVPKLRELGGTAGSVSSGPELWRRAESYFESRDSPDRVRDYLVNIVGYIVKMAPLIRQGVLILRPQLPTIVERTTSLIASVRADIRSQSMQAVVEHSHAVGDPLPQWDNLKGLNVTPKGLRDRDAPWINQWEFFYLAKSLAIADQADATFVPPSRGELELLREKCGQVSEKLRNRLPPFELLAEVASVLVPDMDLSAETAVAMRQSDDDFDDWRRMLGRLLSGPATDSLEELRERVRDELIPATRRIERATSRSRTRKSAAKEQSATTIITGSASASIAGMAGANPAIPASATFVAGVLLWIWKSYRPPSLGGSDAVIASLIRN